MTLNSREKCLERISRASLYGQNYDHYRLMCMRHVGDCAGTSRHNDPIPLYLQSVLAIRPSNWTRRPLDNFAAAAHRYLFSTINGANVLRTMYHTITHHSVARRQSTIFRFCDGSHAVMHSIHCITYNFYLCFMQNIENRCAFQTWQNSTVQY